MKNQWTIDLAYEKPNLHNNKKVRIRQYTWNDYEKNAHNFWMDSIHLYGFDVQIKKRNREKKNYLM